MHRSVLFIPCLALIALLPGCQGSDGDSLSGPASAEISTSAETEAIREMIVAVFPEPGLENAALQRFGNVERQLGRGRTEDAIEKTIDLILFAIGHFEKRRLDGSEKALAQLMNAMLVYVGLEPIFPEGGLGGEDFAFEICDPGKACLVVTGTRFAGLRATFWERTLVTISRLPDDPGPFEPFGFDDFPLFYDIRTTSVADAVGPSGGLAPASATPVAPGAVAGVCVVEPPETVVPDLRLAHLIEGAEGSEVEMLPLAEVDFLDCAETAMEMGGSISAFSPFGAVDQTSGDDDEEGGPTTTTLLLNGFAQNLTIFQGQTATATALVDPAPGSALAPTVSFFWPTFPGGTTPTTARSLIDGEAVLQFLCDATGSLTPGPGVVEVGPGSRFVQARFPGAGDFEPSSSSALILGCLAG